MGVRQLRVDDRARVPFAVVGVLLLVSSSVLVGTMATREPARPDVDAGVVVDQTEAMSQTVIRDRAQRAAELAAEQPLTRPTDNEWGDALTAPALASGADTGVFDRYLKALVYLEVQSALDGTGITAGDVESDLSLPPVTNATALRRGIERVKLREPEPGMLTVAIENVTITASHGDRVVERQRRTVTVSVATPIMQLHDRVSAYQAALDAGVTERGFSQRFNARVYAIGWARGYAQNYRLPVAEVLSERHIEPSANSALYRTQQDIFGAADPALQDSVRLGWLCMAMQDGAGLFDQYMESNNLSYRDVRLGDDALELNRSGGRTSHIPVPTDVDSVADLCGRAELLFGDQATGEYPETPGITDLLGDAPGMRAEDTVTVGQKAYVPLARLTNPGHGDSFEAAIGRVYTVDGAVRTTGSPGLPDDPSYQGECPNGSVGSWRTVSQEELTVAGARRDRLDPETDGAYYRYRFRVRAKFEGQKDCRGDPPVTDTSEWQLSDPITTVIKEVETSPEAKVDSLNPGLETATTYERGGPPVDEFRNYEGVGENVTAGLLDAPDASTASFLAWVNEQDLDVLGGSVSEQLSTAGRVELDHHEFLDAALEGRLAADIARLQRDLAAVSYTFNRTAYIQSGEESPFARLMQRVNETMRDDYLDRERPYESVGQKAVYEARYAYWESLSRELAALRAAHGEAVGALDEELASADAGIDDALTYLRQGIAAEEPEPVPLRSPPVTDNISYEVSGSPTYLVDEAVTSEEVPAVATGSRFAPLATRNVEQFDLPYETVIDVLGRLLDAATGWLPGIDLGSPDPTVSFRLAGDVLLAGELAMETGAVDDRLAHNETYDEAALTRRLQALEGTVEQGIDRFERRMAVRTVTELYAGRAELVDCLAARLTPPTCAGTVNGANTTVVDRVGTALERTERATERALTAYEGTGVNPTALTAVQIGNGNASAPVRENVTAALDDELFHPERFDGNYSRRQWRDVVDSAARPAYEQAASLQVAIGDDPADAEFVDNALQAALGNVSRELVADRLEAAGAELGDIVEERVQSWVGRWSGTRKRAARVPAGLPLVPVPGYWYATTNVWDVTVGGQYARFEATATTGTPATTTATTYVRSDQTVEREIGGATRTLGHVEPVAFEERSLLVVVTPPGVGVGDRDDDNPECSPTFPHVGPLADREPDCSAATPGAEPRVDSSHVAPMAD